MPISSPIYAEPERATLPPEAGPPRWILLARIADILAEQSALSALCSRCEQPGVLDSLAYTFSVPFYAQRPTPRALRSLPLPTHLLQPRAKLPRLLLRYLGSQLTAAVLLYEYHVVGVPSGIYIPGDVDGYRTLVAPPPRRRGVAEEAANFLLTHAGARLVLLSYPEGPPPDPSLPAASPHLLAEQRRVVSRCLPLLTTFDQTLAALGVRTRRNLRAEQRRVVRKFGAVYHPRAELSFNDFLHFDRHSTFRMPGWVTDWRYHAPRTLPDGIFAGLQAADGRWLSFIGGRRQGGIASVDWQMNASDAGALSLVTAMRSFFIADQIGTGARGIRFEYGTPHSIHHSFQPEPVHDLLFTKPSLTRQRLRHLGRFLPPTGTLADTLASPSLVWHGHPTP